MNFTIDTAKMIIAGTDDDLITKFESPTIYGTGTAQKVYLRVFEYLSLTGRQGRNKKGKGRNANDLLAKVQEQHIVKEQYDAISNYWLSVIGQYILGTPLPRRNEHDIAKAEFWDAFDRCFSAPDNPRVLPAIIKGPERSLHGPGGVMQPFTARDQSTLINDIVVRRSCKFLLYHSIQERDREVAYVLDDLNLNTVAQRLKVSETDQATGNIDRKVPVCTSELREIFRRWDFFQKELTFYRDFKVCDPPWLTAGTNYWASYAQNLAVKLQAAHPDEKLFEDLVADTSAAFQRRDYHGTVQAFHDIKPSRHMPGKFINVVSAN